MWKVGDKVKYLGGYDEHLNRDYDRAGEVVTIIAERYACRYRVKFSDSFIRWTFPHKLRPLSLKDYIRLANNEF